MVDAIVSVRMPSSLVQRLKELTAENHFLDVSEELRSVIKVKTRQYSQKLTDKTQEPTKETAHIPHFYYNFYVYQYATSFTASAAISELVLAGDKDATRRYIELLKSGGSDYPIELLKKAGVDMTTSLPFELTMRKMNFVMDEMEKILARMSMDGSTGR